MNEAAPDIELRPALRAAALVGGLLIAQQVVGKAARDALFLSSFPVAALPYAMMASALASLMAVLVFSSALRRYSPFAVVPAAAGLSAVLLLGEWALALYTPRLAALAVYLHMALFGAALVSGFWSLINERFDPYTAKHAMGRIGLGASLGGVVGGLLAWAASRLIPMPALLGLMAALCAAAWLGLSRLSAGAARAAVILTGPSRSALTTLRAVPYLRELAVVVALGALTESLLDYVFKAQAAAAFHDGPGLLAFFAGVNAALGVLGLLAQAMLTRPALATLGLAGSVAVRPAVVAASALLGLFEPRLWTALLARGLFDVSATSLFRSGYELLFTPLPESEKRPTKGVIDVGFDKLGSLLGGGIVLVTLALVAVLASQVLFALALALSLAALAFTGRLQRGYVRTLEQNLRAGSVRLDVAEVADEATRLTLTRTHLPSDSAAAPARPSVAGLVPVAAQPPTAEAMPADPAAPTTPEDPHWRALLDLRSGVSARVLRALRDVPTPPPALVAYLIPLLGRDELFLDVLRVLRRVAASNTGQIVDALLEPALEGRVRRRLPRVLKACVTPRAVAGLLAGLDVERFDVRAQCGLMLAALLGRQTGLRVTRESIHAVVLRELERAPGEGIEVGHQLEHVFTLLSLVYERDAVRLAYWALHGHDRALRGTALEYLENVLPGSLRQALWPLLGERLGEGRAARPAGELVRELLRSSGELPLNREALRRRLRLDADAPRHPQAQAIPWEGLTTDKRHRQRRRTHRQTS
jgi:hypothetical protein